MLQNDASELLLQLLQEEESAASLAPAQPDAEITEQAVTAMPAWLAYRAGLKQKGYFKVALGFICFLAASFQLLPVHISQEYS